MTNSLGNGIKKEARSRPIKFFLVEDSDVTRAALRAILTQNPDFQLAGEAVDGRTALSRIIAVTPDIVLVDVGLPGQSGIEVTRELKTRRPEIKALIFTANEDEHSTFAAFAADADGYMIKRDFEKEILEKAIYTLVDGKCWLDPQIARRVLSFCQLNKLAISGGTVEAVQGLTVEEKEVLSKVEIAKGECEAKPTFLRKLQRFVKIFHQ